MKFAKFMDSNKNLISPVTMPKRTVMEREFQFLSNLYNEVVRLLLQDDIMVKKDTPTFTLVKPVKVPFIL